MKRKLKNKGSALILVLCLLVFGVSVSGVLLTLSYSANVSSIHQTNSQQAYFTARSAVNTTIDYINKNSTNSTAMTNIITNQGTGSDTSIGSYTVNVSYVNANKIKVSSTATYKNSTSTVAAYITKAATYSGIVPTDNLIYLNGSGESGFGQCNINGDIFINGDFNLSQGSKISGKAIINGNATITGAGATTNGLISFGNVILDNSGTVNGDVNSAGNLKMAGGSKVVGNANSDGYLDMSGSGNISGNAVTGNNASFAGGPYIGGALSYYGNLNLAYGQTSTFVHSGATKMTSYTPLNLSSYVGATLPIINAPAITSPAVINNKKISSSGIMDTNFMNSINSLPWGSVVTVDTSSNDINLLLSGNYNNKNGICWEVLGSHNLYIYLTGSASFNVNSNVYVGMHIRSTAPQIFIIGDGNQSVSLNNNSELDAFVYIPNGSFNASGSPLQAYKLLGSCMVKSVNIDSNVTLQYSKPNIAGTPLQVLSSGQSGSGSGGWTVERWSNN